MRFARFIRAATPTSFIAALFLVPTTSHAQGDPCHNAVQGKIPWNAQGNKQWAQQNLDKLCNGGSGTEPAKCFEQLMSGKVNYGGGTKWEWENAVNLCKGAKDANAILSCFNSEIAAKQTWQNAIPKCNAVQPKTRDVMQECRDGTQGKVAWNADGNMQWTDANLTLLCTGSANVQAPKCMRKVMSGTLDYGGGTRWETQNALNLCKGARNADAIIYCFEEEIKAKRPWKDAIPKCNAALGVPPKAAQQGQGAVTPVATLQDQLTECKNAVEGKVAWNAQGNKQWAAANVERLCKGGTGTEPAKCMAQVMSGKINWGGGTTWEWENAVNLCKAAHNASAVIACFENEMRAKVAWQQAIPKCQANPSAMTPVQDQMTMCREAIQGKIPWNAQGNTQWVPANIERLCKGGAGTEPAKCFERLIKGQVNYGGGTNWEWANAIDLCHGTQNSQKTISCFEEKIRAKVAWKQAIPACNP